MAEIKQNCPTNSSSFKEAVCIDAGRVYDSCCDRDCVTDMKCYFSQADQTLVNDAVSVRIRSAKVIDVSIDVEPVTFNRGFYSCDLTFFFMVDLDLFSAPHTAPTAVSGLCFYTKKAILYGSEGNVKTFSSEFASEETGDVCPTGGNSPKCVVQCVDPIALSARISSASVVTDLPGYIPACVSTALGGDIDTSQDGNKVLVTLGLFTIVQLIRNVQMLVPVYDFCIPEKQCNDNSDTPCDTFRKIKFPTDDFFPPRPCNISGGCGCDTETDTDEQKN